jgi:hypothetical protein
VRFSVVVSANPNTQFAWVDFDGNGQLYLVAMQRTINGGVNVTFAYNIWDRNGVLMTKPALPTTLPPGWTTRLYVDDFDRDEQMELLVGYVPPGGPNPTDLYMLQTSTSVAVEPGITGLPSVELASYPNPTFSVSHINYRVPTSGPASLRLYDLAGREVRTLVNGEVAAGSHKATWDGRDANGRQVPAGAYFLKLNAAGRSSSKRVVRVP